MTGVVLEYVLVYHGTIAISIAAASSVHSLIPWYLTSIVGHTG